jgi:hypothetical protein
MFITSDQLKNIFITINERAYYNSDNITNELLGYTIRIPYWSIENDCRETLGLMGNEILSKKYRISIDNPRLKKYLGKDNDDFIEILDKKFIDVRFFGKEFMDGKSPIFSIDKKIYLGDGLLMANRYYPDENKEHHMIVHDGLIVVPLSNKDLETIDQLNTTYIKREFGENGQGGYFKNRFYLRIEFNDNCPGLIIRPTGPMVDVKETRETNSEYYLDNIQIDVKELFWYLKGYSEYIETVYIKIHKDIKFIHNNNVLDYDAFIRHINNQNISVTLIK